MRFNGKIINSRTAVFGLLVMILVSSGPIGQGCSDALLRGNAVYKTITLKINNYCPLQNYSYRDVFVYNASTELYKSIWAPDFDRDGLPDYIEKDLATKAQYGISYKHADFNQDFYSDFFVYKNQLSVSDQNLLPICTTGYQDTDNDGLTDCEEAFLHLDSNKADTDFDGIPDGIEFRFGLNPSDPNDTYESTGGDDMTNLQKVKANFPVTTFVDEFIAKMALKYEVNQNAQTKATDPICYSITVSNIPNVAVSNGNKIMVYATEDTINAETKAPVRETRTLIAYVPQETPDKSTILVSDGIHGQIIDGTTIPLVVIPGGGG